MAQHGQYLNESKNPAIGNPQGDCGRSRSSGRLPAPGATAPTEAEAADPTWCSRALWHPLSDEAIHRTIREGVPGTDMPPTKLSDEETWNLVAFVKSMTGPASENNVPGDPEAGGQIFRGAKAGCSNCHSIRGEGGRMGPDLTDIGASRPLALIKESILEPSKGLHMSGQEGVTVTLKNGKQIQGVARNRNNYSLQVLDRGGNLHLISMLDVEQLDDLRPLADAGRLRQAALRTGIAGSVCVSGAADRAPAARSAGGAEMIRVLSVDGACLRRALPAQVRFEDILKSPGENWLTYAGSYNGWRYAPGRQITPQNAGSLVPKWVYHVPDARAMQTTPIVYDGVMYVTNSNNVYALDARSGPSDLEVLGHARRTAREPIAASAFSAIASISLPPTTT